MNSPKIRFKKFEGEWKTSLVGDLCQISTGKSNTQDKVDDGEYPFYVRSPHVERSNKYLYDEEAVLTVGDGVGTGKVFHYVNGKYDLHQRVYRMYGFKDIEAKYFYYLFSTKFYKRVMSMTAKSSVDSVRMDMIADMEVAYPNQEKQQQISSYFTHLDSLISASTSRLASLKQVKEASLQAMFPQEGETVPKIRFKGFEGEWKKVKLNTFAKRVMRKNSNLESTLALTIASAYGLVSQIDYFNNSVVGANLRNYYLLKKGEFAYNKSYSNGYPFGSVKRLDRYEQGILSTLYIVFSIDDSISSDYLTHFFDTTLWHKDVAERAAEGARNHGLLNIGAVDFLDINIWKPQTKAEQRAIASFFTSLDRRISLETQRLEKLKQIKAACLDKMFV